MLPSITPFLPPESCCAPCPAKNSEIRPAMPHRKERVPICRPSLRVRLRAARLFTARFQNRFFSPEDDERDAPFGTSLSVMSVSMTPERCFLPRLSRFSSGSADRTHLPERKKNAPAGRPAQRLATRMREMARARASSALCTSVSGCGSARRFSARALACSARSTSMSAASSAASARMVTLLSAI